MTRINLIPPADLTDQHLLAERRELPRIFGLAAPKSPRPAGYVLGAGHVTWFYPLTRWLSQRQAALIAECLDRGFNLTRRDPPAPIPGRDGDWTPDADAIATNLGRLRARLHERPGWYRYRGAVVGPDFYDTLQPTEAP